MFVIEHNSIWPYFKRNKNKCNFHYLVMHMITSQVLNSVNFTKTLKSRYLENKTFFFFQLKNFINCPSRATLWQKRFVAKITFNRRPKNHKNKNVEEKPLISPKQMLFPKCSLLFYDSKNCHSSKSNSYWAICNPKQKGETERTLHTLILNYKVAFQEVLLVLVD